MAAYDKNAEENQYPRMLYKGVDWRIVNNEKEEAAAREAGYDADAPSGRVEPAGRDGPARPAAVTVDESRIAALEARIAKLEAEVFDDEKPAPRKGK